MPICKWCGEENPEGVNVCGFCGQDMSIFEDSGLLKELDTGRIRDTARQGESGRLPRATVASMNSGAVDTGAVRSATQDNNAARSANRPQNNNAKKTSDVVTRNQLKQVAVRLDHKARTLSLVTGVIAVVAIVALALGVLAFVRNGAAVKNSSSETSSTIAQLQSQVSMLELELQSTKAQVEEMKKAQLSNNTTVTPAPTEPTNPSVDVTVDNEPAEPTEVPTADPNTAETTGGELGIDPNTEIPTTFKEVQGDSTSIYALIDFEFDGTVSYQWQKSTDMQTWNDVNTSASKTNQLKISVDDYLRKYVYRCRITYVDARGNTTTYYSENITYNAYEIWTLLH